MKHLIDFLKIIPSVILFMYLPMAGIIGLILFQKMIFKNASLSQLEFLSMVCLALGTFGFWFLLTGNFISHDIPQEKGLLTKFWGIGLLIVFIVVMASNMALLDMLIIKGQGIMFYP